MSRNNASNYKINKHLCVRVRNYAQTEKINHNPLVGGSNPSAATRVLPAGTVAIIALNAAMFVMERSEERDVGNDCAQGWRFEIAIAVDGYAYCPLHIDTKSHYCVT